MKTFVQTIAARLFPGMMILIFASFASAQDGIDPAVELRISQTLLNTIKGESVDYPPTPERIQQFRDGATTDAGFAWGVTEQTKSNIDDKEISINLNITLYSDGVTPDADAVAKWNEIVVGRHEDTDSEVGFREIVRGDVRRSRIYYRRESGAIMLKMHVTRTGDENAEQAFEKTSAAWIKFNKFAEEQGLLAETSTAPIRLVYDSPDGVAAVTGDDVIQAPYGDGEAIELSFEALVNSPVIANDKPYRLEFKLDQKSAGSASFVDSAGRPLQDSDGDGWTEIETARGDAPTPFKLKMGKFNAGDNPYALDEFVIGSVRVQISEDGGRFTMSFGIQRRTWNVIVQRFEIMPDSYNPTRQEIENSRGSVYDLDGRLGFNEFVGEGGTLLQNYNAMLDQFGRPQEEIDAGTPVCMSWQRDLGAGKSNEFLVALDKSEADEKLPTIDKTQRGRLVVDFKILQAPKRTTIGPAQPAVDAFGDPVSAAGDGEPEVDALAEEIAIRKKISFEEFSITRFEMDSAGAMPGESIDEFKSSLSARIRLAPDRNAGTPVSLSSGIMGDRLIDSHFPLTNRYLDPEPRLGAELVPAFMPAGISMDPHRHPGIYELRLTATLGLLGDNDTKEVDVAIRYGVSDAVFEVRRLSYETRRSSFGR